RRAGPDDRGAHGLDQPHRRRDRGRARQVRRDGGAPSLNARLLTVTGLRVEAANGSLVVDDLYFELAAGEALGLVGESGSGKTTVAQALLGYTRPGLRMTAGRVDVAGDELLGKDERALRHRRGRLVSYVPQDPGTALNPSIRVGNHIREVLAAHDLDENVDERIVAVLERVQLPTNRPF